MSADDASDDADDFDLPAVESDTVATGAAADSSDCDERLKGLPRLLRFVLMVGDNARHIEARLVAEIDELCPDLSLNAAWAEVPDVATGLALATELDHRAVAEDDPNLRSFADCVRLLCLPTPHNATYFEPHRRVAKALLQAFHKISRDGDEDVCCDVEQFVFGWAALPSCTDILPKHQPAAVTAAILGKGMAKHRIAAAKAAIRARLDREREEREEEEEAEGADPAVVPDASITEVVPDHHLVVARLTDEQMKNAKLRHIIGPIRSVINAPLPLVQPPPLHEVRNTLMVEFPYAVDVIDFVLADLIGCTTNRLHPLLILGKSGAGKTLFVRRVSQALGLPSIWRTDCSRADGAVFGGTDRRWHTAEPCHPFLAVAQAKVGNPIVLLDELEKAGTRSDYGRLWDCLLAFLEPETSCRYPDPALQVSLDLSQISYIATANTLDPLPTPDPRSVSRRDLPKSRRRRS